MSEKLALLNRDQSPDTEKKSISEESNLDTLSNGNLSTSISSSSTYNNHYIPSLLLQQTNQKLTPNSLLANVTSSTPAELAGLDAATMVSLIQHHHQEENLLKGNPSILSTAHFLADLGQSVSHLHNHLHQNLHNPLSHCTTATMPTGTNTLINSIIDNNSILNQNHLAHHLNHSNNQLSAAHQAKFNAQHELLLVEHMQRTAAAQMASVSSHRRRKARTVFSDMQLHGLEKRFVILTLSIILFNQFIFF